jgi:hypothetical protein
LNETLLKDLVSNDGIFFRIWRRAEKRRATASPVRTVSNGRGAFGSQEPPKAIQMTTDVE